MEIVSLLRAVAITFFVLVAALPPVATASQQCSNDLAAEAIPWHQLQPAIVGHSEPMVRLKNEILKVANSKIAKIVLIEGETGSGKEGVARALHHLSKRPGRFLGINSANISSERFEADLFGYEQGSFTGATKSTVGLIELAERGTLFLDEINSLDPANQNKLLRVLDGSDFFRMGGTTNISPHTTFILATNSRLDDEIKKGRFREDLFYRMSAITIRIAPLRERKEDIPELVHYFLNEMRETGQMSELTISTYAMKALESYDWPGNVRQLKNLLLGCAVFSNGRIELEDVRKALDQFPTPEQPLPTESPVGSPLLTLEEVEQQHIRSVLEQFGGNQTHTANALAISRCTLRRKIAELKNLTANRSDASK